MSSVIHRILAQKITAMASMDSIVTDPGRHENVVRNIIELHGVLVATVNPLLDTDIVVELESRKVAIPHGASRMVHPTDLGIGVLKKLVGAVNQLHSLYTLLTKTAVVEGFDGCDEIRIGKEGLHVLDYTTRCVFYYRKVNKMHKYLYSHDRKLKPKCDSR
jgi:hypothetical protein